MGLFHGEVNNLYYVVGKDMIVKRILQMLMKFSSLKSELFTYKMLFVSIL